MPNGGHCPTCQCPTPERAEAIRREEERVKHERRQQDLAREHGVLTDDDMAAIRGFLATVRERAT